MATKTVTVFGLQDGQFTAGTAYMLRQIRSLGATATVAKTGRVTLTTQDGERRIYALELDQVLVDDSRLSCIYSAELQNRITSADSPLSRALRDLTDRQWQVVAQAVR
jgi:hypothetical protein